MRLSSNLPQGQMGPAASRFADHEASLQEGPFEAQFIARQKTFQRLALGFLLVKTPFYFFDETFGRVTLIRYVISAAILIAMLFCITWNRQKRKGLATWVVSIVLLCYPGKFIHIGDSTLIQILQPNYADFLVFLLLLTNISYDELSSLVRRYLQIWIFLLLPAIVIWALLFVNVPLPYISISLGGRPIPYRDYFLVAISHELIMFKAGPFTITRLCGLFYEPGLLGTQAAYLLATSLVVDRAKSMRGMIVLVGLLSMSLAFFLVGTAMLVYYLLEARVRFRNLGGLLAFGALVAGALSLNSDVRAVFAHQLIERAFYNPETGELEGNNRAAYGVVFDEYKQKASAYQLLFGNGTNSNSRADGLNDSSYRRIIYEVGYLGFYAEILFVLLITIWYPLRSGNFRLLILSISIALLLYQRPDPFNPDNLLFMAAMYAVSKKRSLLSHVGRSSPPRRFGHLGTAGAGQIGT